MQDLVLVKLWKFAPLSSYLRNERRQLGIKSAPLCLVECKRERKKLGVAILERKIKSCLFDRAKNEKERKL